MAIRDVYLKIEPIYGYSTVEPDMMAGPPRKYRRDCMRNAGHEDTSIPTSEVDARRLNALIYREYLDPSYLIPKTDKIVPADINEPVYHRRVPGTVIYAKPGDRLQIHVLNWDSVPHSFHLHGLEYGLAADGTWPFGVEATDGRRSDEICPGSNWTYIYDVTNESVGAWPFHDHCHVIGANINRGLFGGIVVLPRRIRPPAGIALPPIVHEFIRERSKHPKHPMPMQRRAAEKSAGASGRMAMGGMPMNGGDGPAPGGMPMDIFPEDFEAASILHFLNEWLQDPGVHPVSKPNDVLHVPLFFHFMSGAGVPAFNSGPIAPGAGPFTVTFGAEGVFPYHCEFHPTMHGKVTVAMGGLSDAFVTIQPAMVFDPAEVTVAPGSKVHWSQASALTHTVTEDGGGLPSYCFNGRTFVGNTPTIVAEAGQRIRWYVFNLDVGMMWHNFHPHAQRWTFAGETIDVRSLGPAESFVLETVAPPPLLLPPDIAEQQDPKNRPRGARPYRLRADFPFHCHVEMHMMQGLVGLVRSSQTVWLTPRQAKGLEDTIGLPLDPGGNECPAVDFGRCEAAACGTWEEVAGLPEVTMMHAALLPQTEKVLYWGHGELGGLLVPNQSRIWDYSVPPGTYSMPANHPHGVAADPSDRFTWDIWSAEHAFLDTPEGKLLVHGGFAYRHAFIFDPSTLSWSPTGSTAEDRFYSTSFTLADGRVLTLFGNGPTTAVARSIEVYDPGTGTWAAPKALPTGPPDAPPGSFNYLFYPWTYLLPGGDLFIAGHQATTLRFDWTASPITVDPAKVWTTIAGERSTGGEKGTSVLLPLRPPGYAPRVLTAGGDPLPAQQTSELIDLSAPSPAWTSLANLNQPRDNQVNSVLLPDGRVLVVGGVAVGPDGGPAELFDPQHPGAGWERCAPMKYKRGYHSTAILLTDGSVLVGGDPPGTWGAGGSTPNERYYPSYYFQPRPAITGSPASVNHGATFSISTPNAPSINEVVLLRPGAVTHGFNMSQRFVGCEITGGGATSVQAKAPPDGNVAPPGWYLLFIVDSARVPSTAAWIRLTP